MSVAVGVVNLTRVTLLSDRVLVKGNIVGDEGLALAQESTMLLPLVLIASRDLVTTSS